MRNIAPPLEDVPTDPAAAIEANLRCNWMLMPIAYNTKPTNYTGHPALAVPCGKVSGMPISSQLIGRFLDDPLLLRIAYAYQRAVDWEAVTGIDRSGRAGLVTTEVCASPSLVGQGTGSVVS